VDVDPGLLARGHEGIGGHVRVRDSGRARGHRHDERAVGRHLRGGRRRGSGRHRGSRRRRLGRVHDAVDESHDLRGCRCGAERGEEVLLDERAGQLGQQLQVVGVPVGGRRDEEDQVCGAVLGSEVDRTRQPGEGQGRLGDRGGTAVRNGEPAGQAGGCLGLTLQGVGGQAVGVGAACGLDEPGQGRDDVLFGVAQVGVEGDERFSDEGHSKSLPTGGCG
jgi:hypothetical protein